jgi:hypothetical protein
MTPEPQLGQTLCLIQVGQKWISGTNDPARTSPRLERRFSNGDTTYGTHAEDRALQLARRIGGKIRRVLVLRWDKKGKLTMARPCFHCGSRLALAGVRPKRVAWSDWNGSITSERSGDEELG